MSAKGALPKPLDRSTRTIRVDAEVKARLDVARRQGERNYNAAICRALEAYERHAARVRLGWEEED